ncbi:MAG: hypothetical protein XE08_0455 [Parcubacteria bacterium 32_520]|nr:MAG: hypothetical protein XD75_0397 [Parcubacteria bacterium 33_209]KUK98698.1 MAG: hypothetical protein XE08_0455 [Parcubacteria bacterium 32_520]
MKKSGKNGVKEIAGIIDADEEQAKKFETPKGKNKAPIDIECE